MKTLLSFLIGISWAGLWLTADQEGMYYLEKGEYIQAAETFVEINWQGVAWYRGGDFKKAAQTFARADHAEGNYNQGNALLMQGQYEKAIASYDLALQKRPDWQEAVENRALAVARAKAIEREGGDMTEGMLGADDIVFDNKAGKSSENLETERGDAISDQEIQALWLNRVQTRPADFLKAKFAYQKEFQLEAAEK